MAFEAGIPPVQQARRLVQVDLVNVEGKRSRILPLKLANGWGLNVEGIQRFAGRWNAPVAFYKVHAREGVFFLGEACRSTADAQSLMTDCMAFCREKGARVQELITNRYGERFYGRNDFFLFLSPFPDSRHFGGSTEELQETAIRLAELDIALAKFPGQGQYMRRNNHMWFKPGKAARFLKEVRARMRGAKSDLELLEDFDYLMEKAEAPQPEIISRAPRQPIHRNIYPRNALFSWQSDELLAFLDFDSIHFSQRIRGLAFAMHMFCREASPNVLAARRNAREFVNAYHSVNPLTDEEFQSIGAILCEEQFRRLMRSISICYLKREGGSKAGLRSRLELLKESETFGALF